MPSLDFRNTNTLWCSVMVETLVRCGVVQAVISPGSRSTAITIALANNKAVETIPVLDERSAAFFALGLSRQHHRPTLLVCTSGTAGANYYPAVIEAQESGVPLIVITADRPPEMRECSSGQTIDQHKLFGGHVNWSHELAVPEPRVELLAYLRQTVAHAVERAFLPEPGPVHLNAPFRDPLAPVADDGAAAKLTEVVAEPFFSHLAPPSIPKLSASLPILPNEGRGVIIAGPSQPSNIAQYAGVVELLSHNTGWPVLAESLSPLRTHAAHGQPFVFTYDILARNKALIQKLKPDFILSLGGWPISKSLREWIAALDVPVWIVSERTKNLDALHNRARSFRADVEVIATTLPTRPTEASYSAKWTGADACIRDFIAGRMRETHWLFEGKAAWLLSQNLPPETPLFVANSMPVRDLEYFWAPTDRGHSIFFNRGANGIDGTLSTAVGIAHGNHPAVLLTGDLALLHDTNGFLLNQKLRGSLTIVLINNHGGGIFEHLPVARFDPPFEDYFATPQEADFGKLASAYGIEHQLVRDWEQFVWLISSLPERGLRVLELRTDRKRDATFRKQFLAEAAAKAGESSE
ncbi:MAG: 2-succinyl-5-enolpyruvyl-6-hydroxy-3-cyclohexene-1-carboxylic-acid synthase [Nibricoccus sp.]